MPYVRIDLLPRSLEQKRAIAEEITASISRIANCRPEKIHIIFKEIEKEDLAIGGVLLSDSN